MYHLIYLFIFKSSLSPFFFVDVFFPLSLFRMFNLSASYLVPGASTRRLNLFLRIFSPGCCVSKCGVLSLRTIVSAELLIFNVSLRFRDPHSLFTFLLCFCFCIETLQWRVYIYTHFSLICRYFWVAVTHPAGCWMGATSCDGTRATGISQGTTLMGGGSLVIVCGHVWGTERCVRSVKGLGIIADSTLRA